MVSFALLCACHTRAPRIFSNFLEVMTFGMESNACGSACDRAESHGPHRAFWVTQTILRRAELCGLTSPEAHDPGSCRLWLAVCILKAVTPGGAQRPQEGVEGAVFALGRVSAGNISWWALGQCQALLKVSEGHLPLIVLTTPRRLGF